MKINIDVDDSLQEDRITIHCREITEEPYENRMRLRRVMLRNGFLPIRCEWRRFVLKDEPCPDTYDNCPVSSEYRKR